MVTAMASAKLVNNHPHHPPYHQHLLLHPHVHHLSIGRSPGPPATGQMTLDYSLPNRSRVSDSDQSELTSLIATDASRSNGNQSDDAFSNTAADASSPPPQSTSPAGSENRDHPNSLDTPTKKNKRKLSEPKKRADFKVKRARPSADASTSSSSSSPSSSSSNERREPGEKETRVLVVDASDSVHSVQSEYSHRPSSSASSISSTYSSSHKKKSPSPDDQPQPGCSTSSSSPPPPTTTTSSSSAPSNHAKSSEARDKDASRRTPSPTPAIPNGIPPQFLHPLLAGVPPGSFGFVPGLYFGGQGFPRGPLPSAFPAAAAAAAVPFHIQQNYIAAAAAAAAAAQSAAAVSASAAQNQSVSSKSEKPESSSPFFARQTSPHPVILQPPQPQTQSSSYKSTSRHHPSPGPSQTNAVVVDSSSFPSSSSSSSHFSGRPRSAKSSADNNANDDDDDDDSMSQAHSPEDLTLGGKMSRKQRKNYKNMTRERRVEANARERTRVHTISAAFDALRRAVPSYSYNQKLSKLAILRIACSYIMSLARLADLDYTSPSEHIQKPLTFAECVDMCTNTIQTEGRARRRH